MSLNLHRFPSIPKGQRKDSEHSELKDHPIKAEFDSFLRHVALVWLQCFDVLVAKSFCTSERRDDEQVSDDGSRQDLGL